MGTTVLIAKTTHVEFDIPQSLVGKELEITYKEVDVVKPKHKAKMGDFWGILSDETANELSKNIEQTGIDWDERINDIWKK